MISERRRDEDKIEGAYALAILYTMGYLMTIGALMFFNIPENNRELLISLVGIMSAAQLGIVKYYYDGSKGAQQIQQAGLNRAGRADAVIQDIAKAAPATAVAAVAAAAGGVPVVIPGVSKSSDVPIEVQTDGVKP